VAKIDINSLFRTGQPRGVRKLQ